MTNLRSDGTTGWRCAPSLHRTAPPLLERERQFDLDRDACGFAAARARFPRPQLERLDGLLIESKLRVERPDYLHVADGSVGDVRVVRSLDSQLGLDQEAVKALKLWTWKPGTRGGEPASVAVQIELTFTLK